MTGGRDYGDQDRVNAALEQAHDILCGDGEPPMLIHGGASGADALAAKYAHAHYWPTTVFPANWWRHGKAAGPRRNQQMANTTADLMADPGDAVCVVFPGGRGTADMVRRAEAAGIRVVFAGER
ncbi:DUF2493 domain-containing protein [Nocardiopsis sp. CT-R113]|uniref:DUF2493 domain-containing protein n=1 Tax=Nocardiopsis codii TaxID=3065942 RepID=A0ABU7KCX4_9ACTN|nr:DUF2493 domain-containing protein [Nocardiopsis sp. CT-R113]MEE2040088.1 DUF2493 domain-containing protein [Nocardiopsis sp. CT-R113]